MADYYPLIARAIAGLDPSAPGESRRALYERARAALIAQLRSVQPPLSESEITRERLSLEEAVRKVESEAAQRARDASRPGGGRAGDAFRATTRAPSSGPKRRRRPRPPRIRPCHRPPPRRRPRRPRLRRHGRIAGAPPRRRLAMSVRRSEQEDRPPRNLRADAPRPQPPQAPTQDPQQLPPTRERTGRAAPRSRQRVPQAPGMRGFRDIAADADDLGRAAAQANRAARKTYANVPSPSPEFDRLEPGMENRGADPDAPYSYDESIEEAERYAPQPQAPRPRLAAGPRAEEARPSRRGVSVQERDRHRHRADPDRRRDPVGQDSWCRRSAACSSRRSRWWKRRRIPRRWRSRRFPTASASHRRPSRSRRWRSASCCMTRIRPIPPASNMSAR